MAWENLMSQGVENRGSLISVPLFLRLQILENMGILTFCFCLIWGFSDSPINIELAPYFCGLASIGMLGGRGVQVGALNRCHLSNWRFNPETVHFLSSKRPFLPTMFVSECYKTKHFGQDSLFHKKPKLGRKNHYFYSVKMGERAKSL